MENKFSISPSTNIMDVLGSAGYTFESAIEDIVDNSISAFAKNIYIHLDYSKPHSFFLYILDDGVGMDLVELKKAAIIGDKAVSEKREKNQLGRYSTGLKSAGIFLCDSLFVSSKRKGAVANTVNIDFKYIRGHNEWIASIINDFSFEKKIDDQGTIVLCKQLKKGLDSLNESSIYALLEKLEDSLSHIYFKFLEKGDVNIYISTQNNLNHPRKIEGWNPFILPENKSTKIIYDESLSYKNQEIKIKSYILPTFDCLSFSDQVYMKGKGFLEEQGFFVYREDRLIYEGGWLNIKKLTLDEKARYARIEVNIPNGLDFDFSLNFSKDKVSVPIELQQKFFEIAKQARSESLHNYEYMKHPEIRIKKGQKKESVWAQKISNRGVVLYINANNPLIIEYCKSMSDAERNKLFALLEKNLPISEIQSGSYKQNYMTKEEIKEALQSIYNNCVSQGMSKEEAIKRLAGQSFVENNQSCFFEFIEELERGANDQGR